MKKLMKPLLILVMTVLTVSVVAQEKKLIVGVKGGINVSNFTGDSSGDAKIGFNVGVTLDYELAENLFLMTGLDFTTKGSKDELDLAAFNELFGEIEGLPSSGMLKMTMNPMYLQLPIHVGYKIAVSDKAKVLFRAGPYLAYGVAGKTTVDVGGIKAKTDVFDGLMKEFDFGLGLGAGVEFGKIGVTLGYDFGLINVSDVEAVSFGDIDVESSSAKNGNFYLSLGYKF